MNMKYAINASVCILTAGLVIASTATAHAGNRGRDYDRKSRSDISVDVDAGRRGVDVDAHVGDLADLDATIGGKSRGHSKRGGLVDVDLDVGGKKNGLVDLDVNVGGKRNGLLDLDLDVGSKRRGGGLLGLNINLLGGVGR